MTEGELNIPGLTTGGGKAHLKRDLESVVLPQDGDPPHFEGIVRTFHDDNSPMGSGHRGSAARPPGFPDLTSCDFSIRSITKDEVHRNQAYVLQMKGEIRVEFSNLSED
jgi:hypothetical protein